jgi:two-component system response regulator YesN
MCCKEVLMTMYKLLIVDDEAEIRRGLRYVDWASVGVVPVEECEHGLEACQWLASHSVDLVLTDIRMPVMNGLELAEHISKRYPHVKTIVLSGYNDFELARESMRYGTLDYLLKPINPDELLAVVARAVESLRKEGQQLEKQRHLEQKVRSSMKLLRQEFLRKLLLQPVTEDEWEEACSAAELLLENRMCTVGIIRMDLQTPWEQAFADKDRKLILFAFDNVLSELWDEAEDGYHWLDPTNGHVYLIRIKESAAACEPMVQKVEQLIQQFKKFRGLYRTTLSAGIGSEQESLHLCLSSRQAVSMFDHCDKNCIVVYDGQSIIHTMEPIPSPDMPQEADESNQGSEEESVHYLVEMAKTYVENNFERSLTLQEVAQHVYINASYLSHLFKEATGVTFVHFLTTCRVEKAKLLLPNPKFKIYEISQSVGYENPRYFAEIFKKYTGMTPYEYRSK